MFVCLRKGPILSRLSDECAHSQTRVRTVRQVCAQSDEIAHSQTTVHTVVWSHFLLSHEACGACSDFSLHSSFCSGPNHPTLYCRPCFYLLYSILLVSFHTFYSFADTSHFCGRTFFLFVCLCVCFFEASYFVICFQSAHNFSHSVFIMAASKSLSGGFHVVTLSVLVPTDCNSPIGWRCPWFPTGVLFW